MTEKRLQQIENFAWGDVISKGSFYKNIFIFYKKGFIFYKNITMSCTCEKSFWENDIYNMRFMLCTWQIPFSSYTPFLYSRVSDLTRYHCQFEI